VEVILAIAALAGVVWGLIFFARGGPLAACLAVLLAGCCFGHPFFHVPVRPIPLTLDRVLWVLLLAAYLVGLRQGWSEWRPPRRPDWILGAFAAVLLASTLLHDWRRDGNAPLAHLVFFYLMPLGVYWVARGCQFSRRNLAGLFIALTCFGVYLAVTAVAEAGGQWWAVFPKYIADPRHQEFFGRGRGPMLNPVAGGYYQTVGLLAAVLLWARAGRTGRAVLLGTMLVLGVGIFCTLTRSVWLGAALGAMIVLTLRVPRQWRAPLLGGVLLVGTLVAATQWERIMAFKRDRALTAQQAAESVKLRPILARVAWNMFLDRPLFGCGYGQYPAAHVDYLADRTTDLPLSKARPYVQHNVFLALLTETGLVGVGLYVALLGFWIHDGRRLWLTGTAAEGARAQGLLFLGMMGCYLANAMFQDMSLMPQANMLLFFLAGVTEGAAIQFAAQPDAVPAQSASKGSITSCPWPGAAGAAR